MMECLPKKVVHNVPEKRVPVSYGFLWVMGALVALIAYLARK